MLAQTVSVLNPLTLLLRNSFLGLTEFKYVIFNYVLVILLTFSYYILLVYSPFSDRVGLPLHNTPFPGVLMKSIGAAFFNRMPFLTSTTCVGCNIK